MDPTPVRHVRQERRRLKDRLPLSILGRLQCQGAADYGNAGGPRPRATTSSNSTRKAALVSPSMGRD